MKLLIIVAGVVALIVGSFNFRTGKECGPVSYEFGSAKNVALALKFYAQDHNGNLPKKLEDLQRYIGDEKIISAGFYKDEPNLAPWKYYPGFRLGDNRKIMVLQSAKTDKEGNWAIAFIDSSVSQVHESKFSEFMERQKIIHREHWVAQNPPVANAVKK